MHEISGVPGAELLQQIGSVEIDGTGVMPSVRAAPLLEAPLTIGASSLGSLGVNIWCPGAVSTGYSGRHLASFLLGLLEFGSLQKLPIALPSHDGALMRTRRIEHVDGPACLQ